MGRWIGRAQRTFTEEVAAPPDEVRDFYVDLNNLLRVHPLVVAVRTVSRTRTVDGEARVYRVRDRIPLKLFALHTTYIARLHVPDAGDVTAEARQFPRVRLHSAVTFEPIGGGTRVIERVQIAAPRPLLGLTLREAVKAHTAMLSGIGRCLR